MARLHGKDVDLAYNAVALEDELKSVSLNFDVPESEITSYADAWQNYLAGKPTVTLEIEGSLDPAAAQGDATLFADLGLVGKVWDVEWDGSTGYNGYGILTRYSITAPVDGPITYSATVRHNGGAAAADGAAPNRA